MPRLSREERLIALGMIQANMNYSQVARHFGCSRTAIRNLVERHAETGSVDDRPRPGRERVTTRSRTGTLGCCIFGIALDRPVGLLVKPRGDITHGSAVQPFGVVCANVSYGVEDRFAGTFLRRFAVAEGYYGHNNASTGLRGVGIQSYYLTSPDFASTDLTVASAYGAGATNDTRTAAYAKRIGGADQVLWYGLVSHLGTGRLWVCWRET